ncbi:PIN domain nuclease [Lacticaseibacillus pabuli]|uniref:PIN domain nuclease n=1 Tax=Lacticaseibacillus pabuli TaxID=3025672 RepID=A0ABY7WXF1_9LACO|nr:PIN domain-containing protein [Lacticaseibacillus sp. KACC 23028]WDF83810.1 PIN domain nuclease [Lacticaseibacillus sp. KACC 23028]
MKRNIVLAIFVVVGIVGGIAGMPTIWELIGQAHNSLLNNFVINAIIGAIILLIVAALTVGWILRIIARAEDSLSTKSTSYLLFGSISTIVGLILANLISQLLFYRLPNEFLATVPPIILMIVLGYLGFRIGTTRRHEWRNLFNSLRGDKNADAKKKDAATVEATADVMGVSENYHHYKILDTSVIIDGRIQTIARIGFIEGTLLVPNFVVHELQLISDSADALKRERGRRGLDILNQMQNDAHINLEMTDRDFEGNREVDGKLLKLAKDIDGIVISNDYNLGKVSRLQNVPILNINELASALKPEVLPGETLHVKVVKAGTERQQGVAYLPEGTMVVVEDGQYYMNQELTVVVTSALQTSAGRMIFARPEHSSQKLDDDKKPNAAATDDKNPASEASSNKNHK